MKYGISFFVMVGLHVLGVNGMDCSGSQKKLEGHVDRSYIVAMNKAFKQGDGQGVLQLYTLEPRLLGHLKGLVSAQQYRAAWAFTVLDEVEGVHKRVNGRIQHASHPVVQKRRLQEGQRARL